MWFNWIYHDINHIIEETVEAAGYALLASENKDCSQDSLNLCKEIMSSTFSKVR